MRGDRDRRCRVGLEEETRARSCLRGVLLRAIGIAEGY